MHERFLNLGRIACKAVAIAGVLLFGNFSQIRAEETPPPALETAETIRLKGAAWNGRMVSVAIKDVSPMDRSPAGWKDFYCFTPKGSIHVLVPAELGEMFYERFADKDKNPQKLDAFVEVARDGAVFLRVRRR